MRFRPLVELEAAELLEPKPPDRRLVDRWLARSRDDHELSTKIADEYPFRAMSVLYEAGLRVCLGLIALEGYRVRSAPGHHRAAIEGAGSIAGDSLEQVLRRLDRARRFRNESLYGDAPTPGAADVDRAVADVGVLIEFLATALGR